jgi:hypothetical protein
VQRERLEQLRAGLAEALAPKDPRAWAQRLLQRAQAGHATPTPAALDMARSTLRARPDELATADYRNPRDAT